MKLSSQRRPSGRTLILAATGSVIVLVAAVAIAFENVWRTDSTTISGNAPATATPAELTSAAKTRVFFGHQSIGENILSGIPAVYSQQGIAAPAIIEGEPSDSLRGGFIAHTHIGENEYPLKKFADFDKALRSGLANQVDVAVMKLCYLDITTDTDIDALFAAYRETMSALQRDYPNLRLIHTTVPVTMEAPLKKRVKIRLGGSERLGQAENVAREKYSNLIRNTYGEDVFDLAAIESTAPDGQREEMKYMGGTYFTLYPEYASDLGHLNAKGAEVAATAFLQKVAQVSQKQADDVA
ncbi:hypothetical protein AAFP30_16140 [Gordonia sp. CPCC 205515]|uniref:hypothetical protein n=1 Tax=Gordonia sp. CPCC 205515 TaxID=3140791 RepID=UPI003AF347D7